MGWHLFGLLLSKAQFALWTLRNPGNSFKEFYAESIVNALTGKEKHPSLGPNLKSGSSGRARQTFQILMWQGIRPSDTLVDYGCGTLRVGALLIQHLERDRYIGLDIDDRILAVGRNQLPADLIDSKRPTLEVISPESLSRAAARKPRWVCSKGVLQHVPPEELNEFFENLSYLIHAGATGLLFSQLGRRSKSVGVKKWVYDFNHLQAAAKRHDMQLDRLERQEGLMRLRSSS